jgi:hypothetical protein
MQGLNSSEVCEKKDQCNRGQADEQLAEADMLETYHSKHCGDDLRTSAYQLQTDIRQGQMSQCADAGGICVTSEGSSQ